MLSSVEPVERQEEAATLPQPSGNEAPSQVFYSVGTAWLNRVSRGHAAEALRLGSFLLVGGLATLPNLACVWLFARYTPLPYDVYIVLATELSLLCNFALNDRLTFHALGRQRSWWVRCLRFHGPASVGFVLTLLLSSGAHHLAHLPPVLAQGVAIGIVTFVNFAMHRLWTYRAVSRGNQQPSPVAGD